ncbi:hypothetical protein [Pseudomonas capsici]|uniref:Lipoprotein n=1 Tax=Pseudomonas capsici TaxID=2810614 RepID=A0ABT3BUN5_9PSED|nr:MULTISPECIES: hypothetical protein [Pseudomonas]MBN6714338.1 hypothetical protein [Pseudomonas capsici]MBN6719715.1 hypothetical protein [Pseudomonas capsici]MBN6723945.1 hypothetical protein [Pseudomonas capsici]MBX8474239.1 hypothetical protein [Pseudomonas cichorii]MCV4266077.1 hypothetical protein [Pseudomonas capsici]
MKRLLAGAVLGVFSAVACMALAAKTDGRIPLETYIGKYPWEKVNGIAFIEDPDVRAAVIKAAPSAMVSDAVLGEDMISPILKVDDRLLASGWDRRSGGSVNWAILAALDGSRMALCYYEEYDNNMAYWYVDGEIVVTTTDGSGCPSEAGDIADMGTFPIGPVPDELIYDEPVPSGAVVN